MGHWNFVKNLISRDGHAGKIVRHAATPDRDRLQRRNSGRETPTVNKHKDAILDKAARKSQAKKSFFGCCDRFVGWG
jgi:hypothetical protein